jgi:hypothetical protein
VLLGGGIAAAQLLPTLEFITHSLRAGLSYQAVSAGLPLPEFVSIIYPGFFGGSPLYVGIASLALIGLALVLGRPRYQIFFWTALGTASLLLAFGGNTFLYPLFYLLAPGFESVRQQERVLLLFSFSAAVLAGYGAMSLAGPLTKPGRQSYARFERRLRLIAGGALGLTIFLIYGATAATARGDEVNLFFGVLRHHLFGLVILGGMLLLLACRPRRWLRRPWGMGLVALWLGFNLFSVNWQYNLEKPAGGAPFTPDGITRFLQTHLSDSPGRIASAGLLPGGHSAAAVYDLEDTTGNTPLQIARVALFSEQMPAWRFWQLLNVHYVIDTRDIADAGLTLVFMEGERKVFAVGDPFPAAWFVSEVEVIGPDEQAITRLAADDFDLRRAAVLPAPLVEPPGAAGDSAVTGLALSPHHVQATVRVSDRQLLIFSQIYYPGWHALIDGRPAELLRVNLIQQGVIVPAGTRRVELFFSPASFWLGAGISTTVIFASLVILGWNSRRLLSGRTVRRTG